MSRPNLASRLLVGLLLLAPPALADDAPSDRSSTAEARRTAVALNYCRASFHRIRRTPSKRVLLEERERILDNLNLNGIADEPVVGLYTAVLEEIGRVRIQETERRFLDEAHRRDVRKVVAGTFVGTGMQIASGQYVAALRSGAAGWWDVRARGHRHELDEWRIEREHQEALVAKSSKFLDTFWRLARDKQIPDHWLMRDTDLDKLAEAMQERDPKVRLRVLQRMDRYLECYPPYHYYVGRTQQELGQLFAANQTYARMAAVGTGHFRKDELLATGLANRAVIQAYLRQPEAAETARLALRHADDVWQGNLACASVLEQFDAAGEAEDAILRNLDVDLEQDRSTAQLVGLYHRTKHVAKLREQLADAETVARVPAPLLAAAAAQLAKAGELPTATRVRLATSLQAYADTRFGKDDLIVNGTSSWLLRHASVGLVVGRESHTKAMHSPGETVHEARFGEVGDFGNPLGGGGVDRPVVVLLAYPDGTSARVLLGRPQQGDLPRDTELPTRSNALVPVAIVVDGVRLDLAAQPRRRTTG